MNGIQWGITAFTLYLMVAAASARAQDAAYTVAEVSTGDKLTLSKEGARTPVRLYGVDAPDAGQPFFDEAKALVMEATQDKTVAMERVAEASDGLAVARITVPGAGDLSTALVKAGLAWHDAQNAPEASALKAASAKALVAEKGLWSQEAPLAPWDYRRTKGVESVNYSAGEALAKGADESEPEEAPEERPRTLAKKGEGDYVRDEPAQVVDTSKLDYDQGDVPGLLSKHQPRMATDDEGNPLGLTANNISSLPIARQRCLQNGDIIASVNGIPLTSEGQVINVINRLKGSRQLNLEVVRGGNTVNIPVNLR